MEESKSFQDALSLILAFEGGLSNDKRDPGGLTNFGITSSTLAAARGFGIAVPESVFKLTPKQVKAIYWNLYWTQVKGDSVRESLALMLFDAAVQHGVSRSIQFMQAALRVKVDGDWGPHTQAALDSVYDYKILIEEMGAQRAFFYMKLDATDDTFGLGWARRLLRVQNKAQELELKNAEQL